MTGTTDAPTEAALEAGWVRWRQDFHRFPETGFNEQRTSDRAAQLLSSRRDFDGTVRFIFQPAEEHGRGAAAMLADGLLQRFPMDEIYGAHNIPGMPAGHIATRVGGIMASEDNFVIRITGRGG